MTFGTLWRVLWYSYGKTFISQCPLMIRTSQNRKAAYGKEQNLHVRKFIRLWSIGLLILFILFTLLADYMGIRKDNNQNIQNYNGGQEHLPKCDFQSAPSVPSWGSVSPHLHQRTKPNKEEQTQGKEWEIQYA